MNRLLALLSLLAALVGPATSLADPVEDAAAAVTRAEADGRELEARRAALRTELDGVAAAIEARKEKRRGVLEDRELTDLLRRSQALAERISALDREAAGVGERRIAAALALLAAHDAGVADARRALATAVPERRAAALEALRRRQADREAARRGLLARLGGPDHAPAPIALAPTDDPDELREQADLFRDDGDRVRRALAAVERRLREHEQRAELERQLRDFVLDGELHEEDRRVTLRRQETSVDPSGQTIGEGRDGVRTETLSGALGPLPDSHVTALPGLTGEESPAELQARKVALERLSAELDARARALDAKAREAGGR